jgi:HSP20 family protein
MLNTRILTTPVRARTLDRVFDQALDSLTGRVWIPAIDVAERRDAFVIHAELPGVSPEHVDVRFEQNVLTICGTRQSEFSSTSPEDMRLLAAERASGDFARSVRLPDGADVEQIQASFTNGLLSVTVPKAKTAQPRKIALTVGSGTDKPAN